MIECAWLRYSSIQQSLANCHLCSRQETRVKNSVGGMIRSRTSDNQKNGGEVEVKASSQTKYDVGVTRQCTQGFDVFISYVYKSMRGTGERKKDSRSNLYKPTTTTTTTTTTKKNV